MAVSMDKLKKAFWLSVFLTGAGQFYLGEKKKGCNFLIFSILGIVFICIGTVFIADALFGFLAPSRYGILLFAGFSISATGLALIIVMGYKSIKDITSRNRI